MPTQQSWPEAVRLAAGVRLAGAVDEPASGAALATSGRIIRYMFCDDSVGRDNHVITADAWELANFKRNPVFLWSHDADQPAIGRVVEISAAGGKLRGAVEYAERDVYPFADTIFQLTRAGFINATSVGWWPLEWRASRDRSRPGGMDFTRVDLLEISQVMVPAMPEALVEARAQGIDTGPLVEWAERMLDTNGFAVIARAELELLRKESKMPLPARTRASSIAGDLSQQRSSSEDWKCGASRTLPLDEDSAWDGPAAEKSIFEAYGFDGDKPDAAKARKAFLAYDAGDPTLKGSYKLPFAKVVDGRLTAVAAGVRAAASRLPDTDIPDDVKESARAVLDEYEKKMKKPERSAKTERASPKKRGLYHCAWLASVLADLACILSCSETEAAFEGDDSPVPGELAAAAKALGKVLIDMTVEELEEAFSDGDGESIADEPYLMAAGVPAKRQAFRLLRGLDDFQLAQVSMAMDGVLRGERITFTRIAGDPSQQRDRNGKPLARAGKALSAESERCLRGAHDHISQARELVRGLLDKTDDGAPDDDDPANDDDDAKRAAALRKRKAHAVRIAAQL